MKHAGWLTLFIVAVGVMWWGGLNGIAVLVTLVVGLAGLAFLVVRTRQPTPSHEADRDARKGEAERDIAGRS
jgi:hypothetical protein